MTHVFSQANRHRLETVALSNVLLAFDFDGTLAPIVSSPAAAAMRPSTRQLVTGIARLYPSVVISGRAVSKGVALERERGRLACDAAIYIGGDEADEDVFRLSGRDGHGE